MERINWDSTYSVGVLEIDAQHRRIIDVINLLGSDSEATVRSETISDVLNRLTQYSMEHFRSEERILGELKYPGLKHQIEDHRQYRRKVVALCQATVYHLDSVPTELVEFIGDWWKQHILISDAKYRTFLAEHLAG